MTGKSPDLQALGWSPWLARHRAEGVGTALARVVAVDRQWLLVQDGSGTFRAKLSGNYLFRHQGSSFPCVGDWVEVERQSAGEIAMVQELLPRKTSLRRRAAGDQGEALANKSVEAVRDIVQRHPTPAGVEVYVTGAAATTQGASASSVNGSSAPAGDA